MMSTKAKLVSFVLLLALMATPVAGCVGNMPPTAAFLYSPPSPNTGESVLFTDNSTDDGFIASWDWNFGDGNTSTIQNPTHSFAAAGTYTVSLTVTDDDLASDTCTTNITVTSPLLIGAWDAIEILVKQIIPPASAYKRISAFMLSEPLQVGDVVTSDSGNSYPITVNTWFIFIDDAPEAAYAHATRYVFMDARDGSYNIVNETWPPVINNFSMWNDQLNRGHLIELWSVLDNPVPIASGISDAPTADYGDAPDGQYAYWGIPGNFPTLFNTTNSHFGRPGGHTLNVGEETLGLNVSAEVDAIDPNDPDGVPNLVDADSDERIYVIMEGTQAKLAFTVTVSPNAPDMTRHANALIDFDYSGNWSTGAYGPEWVVVNLDVNVDPGDSETILTPFFTWANPTPPPAAVWMRLALTRAEVDESLFANVGGWDGSGQYAYGEFEDKFVFLTDIPPLPEYYDYWPPPPPNGPPPDGNGPPPTDGKKGPCGYDIQYFVITINCGDLCKHVSEGNLLMKPSADLMAKLASEQGYTSMGNLGPEKGGSSQTSWDNIFDAFLDLADAVQCGDHVLIYICGHGHPDGGIAITNSAGEVQDWLLPSDLELLLDMIPPCDGMDCNLPEYCCHVSVIIESCFAANFDIPGVTGEGRSITGTSSDECCWLFFGEGGVYTKGFDEDSRDPAADTNKDGIVDPAEAHVSAVEAVNDHNRDYGKDQEPWNDEQWCDCICPCQPGIDVEKWIWYDLYDMWVKEIDVEPGALIDFVLEIENDGNCRDIIDIVIIDYLPLCLDYDPDSFFLYYNGVPIGYRPPDEVNPEADGVELIWYLEEIDFLSPGDFLSIEYYAFAIYPGANINWLYGSAHCAYDYSVTVYDEASATVYVYEEEVIAEDVLYGWVEVGAECTCDMENWCLYCDVYSDFGADDISMLLGPYPVTNVKLYVNGILRHDSGPISQTHYSWFYDIYDAGCGISYTFMMVATNSIGLTVTVNKSFTTPMFCD